MSHVLVSYKREDEPRVAKLVRALQSHGLDVWWDQSLPGGEAWRDNIETALDQAGCVVVAWTHGSVGPEGGFVRDEAGRAKARNVLVPIRLEDVGPPLGFGELQAIDLRHWKGNPRDPFLLDLVAACRAKLDGQPVPPAKGPMARLVRRARTSSLAAAALAALWGFASNFYSVQNHICTIPVTQPTLSDMCGAIGLGQRPSRAERLAWAARRPGNCADLRAHINRFPSGAYHSEGADLLAAATSARAATYSAAPRAVRGYVRQSAQGFGSTAAAQADALVRAQADATSLCAPLDDNERLDGVQVAPGGAFDCRPGFGGGTVCALDYSATCRIESRPLVEHCG
jgi:hypothetical protein